MVVDVPSISVMAAMGPVLLASYIMLAQKYPGTSYIDSSLWLGMGRPLIIALVCLQLLAAVGFLAAICTWVFAKPPVGGLLSYHKAILPVLLGVFLASSSAWAFLLLADKPSVAGVSISLVVTAICTILLIAGAAEETVPRWWIVVGLMLLGLITVLGDAVVWNSRWIAGNGLRK